MLASDAKFAQLTVGPLLKK